MNTNPNNGNSRHHPQYHHHPHHGTSSTSNNVVQGYQAMSSTIGGAGGGGGIVVVDGNQMDERTIANHPHSPMPPSTWVKSSSPVQQQLITPNLSLINNTTSNDGISCCSSSSSTNSSNINLLSDSSGGISSASYGASNSFPQHQSFYSETAEVCYTPSSTTTTNSGGNNIGHNVSVKSVIPNHNNNHNNISTTILSPSTTGVVENFNIVSNTSSSVQFYPNDNRQTITPDNTNTSSSCYFQQTSFDCDHQSNLIKNPTVCDTLISCNSGSSSSNNSGPDINTSNSDDNFYHFYSSQQQQASYNNSNNPQTPQQLRTEYHHHNSVSDVNISDCGGDYSPPFHPQQQQQQQHHHHHHLQSHHQQQQSLQGNQNTTLISCNKSSTSSSSSDFFGVLEGGNRHHHLHHHNHHNHHNSQQQQQNVSYGHNQTTTTPYRRNSLESFSSNSSCTEHGDLSYSSSKYSCSFNNNLVGNIPFNGGGEMIKRESETTGSANTWPNRSSMHHNNENNPNYFFNRNDDGVTTTTTTNNFPSQHLHHHQQHHHQQQQQPFSNFKSNFRSCSFDGGQEGQHQQQQQLEELKADLQSQLGTQLDKPKGNMSISSSSSNVGSAVKHRSLSCSVMTTPSYQFSIEDTGHFTFLDSIETSTGNSSSSSNDNNGSSKNNMKVPVNNENVNANRNSNHTNSGVNIIMDKPKNTGAYNNHNNNNKTNNGNQILSCTTTTSPPPPPSSSSSSSSYASYSSQSSSSCQVQENNNNKSEVISNIVKASIVSENNCSGNNNNNNNNSNQSSGSQMCESSELECNSSSSYQFKQENDEERHNLTQSSMQPNFEAEINSNIKDDISEADIDNLIICTTTATSSSSSSTTTTTHIVSNQTENDDEGNCHTDSQNHYNNSKSNTSHPNNDNNNATTVGMDCTELSDDGHQDMDTTTTISKSDQSTADKTHRNIEADDGCHNLLLEILDESGGSSSSCNLGSFGNHSNSDSNQSLSQLAIVGTHDCDDYHDIDNDESCHSSNSLNSATSAPNITTTDVVTPTSNNKSSLSDITARRDSNSSSEFGRYSHRHHQSHHHHVGSSKVSVSPQKISKRSFSEADKDLVIHTTAVSYRNTIVIPPGWKRETVTVSTSSNSHNKQQKPYDNDVVYYISPSGTKLRTWDELKHYICSDGTCKCGLSCPLRLEQSFSFDPKVTNSCQEEEEGSLENLNETPPRLLCNHKRKIPKSEDSPLISSTSRDDLGECGEDGISKKRRISGDISSRNVKAILPKGSPPITRSGSNVSVPLSQQSPDTTTQTSQNDMSPASSEQSVFSGNRSTNSTPTPTTTTSPSNNNINSGGKGTKNVRGQSAKVKENTNVNNFGYPWPQLAPSKQSVFTSEISPTTTTMTFWPSQTISTTTSGSSIIPISNVNAINAANNNNSGTKKPGYQHHLTSKVAGISKKRANSPCPNIDVRQIPLEQNQPPPRQNQLLQIPTSTPSQLTTTTVLSNDNPSVSFFPITTTTTSPMENPLLHMNTGYSISPVITSTSSSSQLTALPQNILGNTFQFTSQVQGTTSNSLAGTNVNILSLPIQFQRMASSPIVSSGASGFTHATNTLIHQSLPSSITISMVNPSNNSNNNNPTTILNCGGNSGNTIQQISTSPSLSPPAATVTASQQAQSVSIFPADNGATSEKSPLQLVQDVVDRFHKNGNDTTNSKGIKNEEIKKDDAGNSSSTIETATSTSVSNTPPPPPSSSSSSSVSVSPQQNTSAPQTKEADVKKSSGGSTNNKPVVAVGNSGESAKTKDGQKNNAENKNKNNNSSSTTINSPTTATTTVTISASTSATTTTATNTATTTAAATATTTKTTATANNNNNIKPIEVTIEDSNELPISSSSSSSQFTVVNLPLPVVSSVTTANSMNQQQQLTSVTTTQNVNVQPIVTSSPILNCNTAANVVGNVTGQGNPPQQIILQQTPQQDIQQTSFLTTTGTTGNNQSLRYPLFQTIQPFFLNSTGGLVNSSGGGQLIIQQPQHTTNPGEQQSFIYEQPQQQHQTDHMQPILQQTTMVLDPSVCGNQSGPKKKKKRLSKKQQQQQAQLHLQQQLLLQQLQQQAQVQQQVAQSQQQFPFTILPQSFNLGPQGFSLQPMNMNFFPTPTILTLPNLILNPADGSLFLSPLQTTTQTGPQQTVKLGQFPITSNTVVSNAHQGNIIAPKKDGSITLTSVTDPQQQQQQQQITLIKTGPASADVVSDDSRQNATPDSSTNDCQLGLNLNPTNSITISLPSLTSSHNINSATNQSKKVSVKSRAVSSSSGNGPKRIFTQKQILPKIDSTTPTVENG